MPMKGTKQTRMTKQTAESPTLSAEKLKWLAEKKAESDAAYAAYRLAHPVPEMVTGSPYQTAREEWRNGQQGTDGAFDHWTSNK